MARDTLQAEGLRLTFDPALGAAILSLTHEGVDLLRPTPEGATDVLETACFPLVPYANRIADGRFTFAGRTAALSSNMAGQAHPLHGEGWRGAWTVDATGADFVTLIFEPEATAWPWRYRARQTFKLRPDGLTLELEVTNLDDEPGPFGLGFHPYFPNSSEAKLTAKTTGVWEVSPDLLPIREVATAPWLAGAPVRSDRLVDHCHTGWDSVAHIDLARRSLRLAASTGMDWLHVYAPPDEDFFCVEPVSHAPNALNMADPVANGIRLVDPGRALQAWMRLDLM